MWCFGDSICSSVCLFLGMVRNSSLLCVLRVLLWFGGIGWFLWMILISMLFGG